MSQTATIVYCSSNMENPAFEQRVRDTILKNSGGLPIICVSQKPIPNFGENIVVGDDIGVSGFNFFRQVQIGCERAKTEFIISAEADCLYPPDYFQFRPPVSDVPYRNKNLYVMPDRRSFYFKKEEGATHAQVVGRQFYLDRLTQLFEGAPQWSAEEKNFPRERGLGVDVFKKIAYWETENPVVQIKTHRGMRYYTHSDRVERESIDYWGDGDKIRRYYLYGET